MQITTHNVLNTASIPPHRSSKGNPAHIKRALLRLILLIVFVPLNLPSVCAKNDDTAPRRLILFQGFILNAYYKGQYSEIKRLSPDGIFYGYGWLDKNRVFVAYQKSDTAEAVSDFDIIDLKESKTTKLNGIGGVGETNFDVNTSTGRIVFSQNNEIDELIIAKDGRSYRIVPIKTFKKFDYCWSIFWIDTNTVGCNLIHSDKMTFKKYDVP